jgi:ABC-type dipeptide/oligopeptide/nickel transport system permease subunit
VLSPSRRWARFAKNRSAVVGGTIVLLLVVFALAGPLVAQRGPLESDFVAGVSSEQIPVGPGREFLLGADRLFRDVFARLAYGGRLSLLIAVTATAIASAIGAAVGVVAGYLEGQRVRLPGLSGPRLDVDGLLMRAVDVMLAFPFLLLVMALGAAQERTSALTLFLTLGCTGWLGIARVLRAKTMQVRTRGYVLAARALGQSTAGVMWRHVLPNVGGTLVVSATVLVAQMIVADSVLSYLGVGISPPTPTWGRMLFEGQDYLLVAPWLVAAPGGAILLAVWGFNMLGEGLRDALDPRDA